MTQTVELVSLNEYAEWTLSTAKYLKTTYTPEVTYPTDEIVDETGEFVRAVLEGADTLAKIKEAGDIFYGIARTCEDAGLDINQMFYGDNSEYIGAVPAVTSEVALLVAACAIKGVTKKICRDNGGVISEDRRVRLHEAVQHFCLTLRGYLAYRLPNYTIEYIASVNRSKLIDRKNRNVLSGDGDNR